MNVKMMRRLTVLLPLLMLLAAAGALAQGKITTPKEFLGFDAGDDYMLANYTQLKGYWEKLAQETNRMKLVEIGKTAEGRPMIMAIITSPENQKNLARYKEISRRLAHAEGLTDDQARKLAAEGKAVIWIDGGLHATESVPAQHLFHLAHQMASRTDAETMRILNDVILLVVPANPDGMELVSNWYMRNPDPKSRSMNTPRLYQKYVGHDNNRDSYANNQPETAAISRQQFIEWFPHVVYNQHQTGPAGTVLFMAPFRDPFNYNFDPLVPQGIELVGAAIHTRFITEGKPGAVMRGAASYSTWFNGGVRTTTYFHNQIGLLSEIIGNPTPISIPFIPTRQLPSGDQPFPIQPQQVWHQRQSIEYLLTADRAILDLASKDREGFLYRAYVMGRNSIARGSTDNWTMTPKKIAAVQAAIARDAGATAQAPGAGAAPMGGGGQRGGGAAAKYLDLLREPAKRDPRAFILPSDQPDFLTAGRFVNALLKSGVTVHRATGAFQVAGKSYPAGSYVVKTAQAFRPHVMDMFEPQDHPDDIPYPGGPPRPPYDATGWTLAYQMGVKFDRIIDGVDGPFEKIPDVFTVAPGKVTAAKTVAGYLLNHQQNDAFVATNRLLAAKEDVYWLKSPVTFGTTTYPAGALYVPAKPTTKAVLDKVAAELGLNIEGVAVKPTGEAFKLKATRVALWDRYGGSMDSGWIRWILEQAYPTTFEVVYAPALDAGDLNSKYNVIIFPNGSIPAMAGQGGGGRGGGGGGGGQAGAAASIPEEFRAMQGSISADKTIPQLKKFVENGGTIIAIGSGTSIAGHFKLPIGNHMAEQQPNGTERRLGNEKFYAPGSVMQVAVDNTNPLAWGMGNAVDVFYDNSPVFRLNPDAALKGVKAVAWFDSPTPLRSGWAWGQNYLQGGAAVVDASVGKGKVFLFGPEVMFRGQPHGTFKFVFNGIYLGTATTVTIK